MNRYPLLVSILCLAACSGEYDLSRISTDGIAVGSDESEFCMPLATVSVGIGDLGREGEGIQGIFEQADIWLPSRLPAPGEWVDLRRLAQPEPAYVDALLDALIEELSEPFSDKATQLASLIWSQADYRVFFAGMVPAEVLADREGFVLWFARGAAIDPAVREQIRSLAERYLTGIALEDVTYAVSGIDLGKEVIDMLADNLDPRGTVDARNTLGIYGTVRTGLPLGLTVEPRFEGTQIVFAPFTVLPGEQAAIEEALLWADDLHRIVEGFTVRLPLQLERYYPARDFDDAQRITLTLSLRKRGALKF